MIDNREFLQVEVKNGAKWEQSYYTTSPEEIYKGLMQQLIAKKLHKCTYIRSIKEIPLYDGTRKIIVYYDNSVKATYRIAD